MSKTIRLKRATEMTTPYRGRGKVSLMHTFAKGTPVLYSRLKLADGTVHHKVSIRWEGELYERHMGWEGNVTGRSSSCKHPNIQQIIPRTEDGDRVLAALRKKR